MPDSLFREEALDFWTRQRGPGAVLRIAAPWVRWLYWMVLALVVAGLALAYSVRVEESVSGPALINSQEGTFVALLPAGPDSDLPPGQSLRIEDDLSGRAGVAARVRRAVAASDDDVRRAGFTSSHQPGILVTGDLAPESRELAGLSSAPRSSGRVVVVLRSERALTVFLRGFEGVWGGGDS